MRCPNCDSENNEGAKFCKKCGTPLKKKVINHENMINSMNDEKKKDNTTKIITVILVIVAIVLAATFVYIYTSGSHNNSQDTGTAESASQPSAVSNNGVLSTASQMKILGGSFDTGSALEDKTYATIKVGSEFAGEKVTIQIKYSRDGSPLNDGNMVAKTVDSSGNINVKSADAYRYYPDYAEINLYDDSGNLLDSKEVTLSPESGTQTF